MVDFIDPRIVAAVQILVAMGIARFWTTWLRAEHEEPWLPTGYVEHERCFVYPDSVLAALMVVAAILLFLGNSLGERLTLVCGGISGSVDNVLRPRLVGRDTQMPDLVILISTLGGIGFFGAPGFIVGPLVAAFFITLWQIMAEAYRPTIMKP